MTLKEAKKILKKEGFCLVGTSEPFVIDEAFTEFERPKICEAMQILNSSGYGIMMARAAFNARKARLKEQLEEHSNAPTSGSPALKEAASQFNDALLDEQGKKIKHLTKKIARLNKIIHKKNLKIEEFRKESSRHLRGKIKMFGENMDLSQELCDKNEELRLTKIREKNLAEVCQKYVKENEELKKKLADKIVDINAKCMRAARESINDVFESYAAKYAKSTLDELKDKAYESFNAKAHKLGLVGSKDGKGIPDQMIRVDIAEELSKVPDDVIDQFLLFGEIIIKEEK